MAEGSRRRRFYGGRKNCRPAVELFGAGNGVKRGGKRCERWSEKEGTPLQWSPEVLRAGDFQVVREERTTMELHSLGFVLKITRWNL